MLMAKSSLKMGYAYGSVFKSALISAEQLSVPVPVSCTMLLSTVKCLARKKYLQKGNVGNTCLTM